MYIVECADLEGLVLGSCLGVLEEDGGRSRSKLIAAVEARNLENEEVAHDLALELGNEISGSLGRAT